MRLGLALGSGFQSALNTFGTVNDLADKMDERDADKRVRDALTSVPGVGSEYQDASGQTTRMTQPEYDRRRAEALGAGGRPRDVSASIQARTAVSQLTTAEMERARMGFVDSALRANSLLESGDRAGALQMMQDGYNRFMPDGVQATLRMDGNQVVGDRVGPNGQALPPMRFENIAQAAQVMLRFSSAPAYEAHLNRALQERGQDRSYRVGMAGVAATRYAADRADARHTEEMELRRRQQSTQAGLIEQQAAEIRQRVGQREESLSGLNEFERRLRENPLDPELPQLATRLYTRDPEGFRGVVQRELPDGTRERVPVNTLGILLEGTQQRYNTSINNINEQLGRNPTRQDVEAARERFDRNWGNGSFNRQFGDRYSSPSAAPTTSSSRPPARNQGLPTGSSPAPAADPFTGRPSAPQVTYDAYRPPAPAPTGGGSHLPPGLPQRQPQQTPPGASRSVIEDWLRANPPPQAR
jgi:hypothetical protein